MIQGVPPEERDALLSMATAVPLEPRKVLFEPDATVDRVYFPAEGVVSIITVLSNGSGVETGIVGREGMIGLPAFLGTETTSNARAIVQIGGRAHSIEVGAFRDILRRTRKLPEVLLGYTHAVLAEASQEVACNRQHTVDERLARWLLMTEDRVGADEFRLTQDFLAKMLGVRRPSVTVAAGILQKAGLIKYHRGQMKITDRIGLEEATCECYDAITSQYERLVPGFSRAR